MPVIIPGITFPDLASPPANTPLGSSGAPFGNIFINSAITGVGDEQTVVLDIPNNILSSSNWWGFPVVAWNAVVGTGGVMFEFPGYWSGDVVAGAPTNFSSAFWQVTSGLPLANPKKSDFQLGMDAAGDGLRGRMFFGNDDDPGHAQIRIGDYQNIAGVGVNTVSLGYDAATGLSIITISEADTAIAPEDVAIDAKYDLGAPTKRWKSGYFGGSVTAMDFIPATTRAAHLVYAGPSSGSAAVPTWRAMVAGDIPDLSATYATPGSVITYVSGAAVPLTRTVNGHALSADVTVTKSDLSLGSVENTALSTWAGSTNLATLGTIATGTWNATAIAVAKGGTGSAFFTVAGPSSARTYTFPDAAATIARTDAAQTFTLANDTTMTVAGGSVTSSGTTPFLSVTGTFNTSGAAAAIRVNVTNTSGAASSLLDLQVASTSQFKVSPSGFISIPFLTGGQSVLVYGASSSGFKMGWRSDTTQFFMQRVDSSAYFNVDENSFNVPTQLGFGTTTAPDALLRRGAAATLQMGTDVNGAAVAQTFQSCRGITGTDKTGAPFHFVAGPGTGAATVSYIDFTTPTVTTTGATQQTGAVRATISSAGLNATVPIAFGGNLAISNAVPTISSGFGSGATIAGIAGGFRITCGTAPGVGGTVAFNATYANAPVCFVQDETTGILGIAAPTTTTVVISGLTLLAGQTVAVFVFGY